MNNELQSVQIPGVESITIPAYTWNRLATITYPGGTQSVYGYDALMRLDSFTVLDPGSNPLLDYSYTYDNVGNIETKTTEHGLYRYDYDDSSRLLTADNPVLDDEAYTYDNVGNRLTSADVSGSWNYNLNNELLGYVDVEYDYDANGNLTEVRTGGSVVWTYTYDAANRLVHVEDGTGTISADYSYDPFGRRLWKDVDGTRTYFFYSEEGLIAEYDASGVEIRGYGYKPDSTWTTDPLWLKVGSTYYWYQNDHLGTPQKLMAQDGTVVWSAQYTAFGEADVQVETVTNNLRFPGQYEDVETGLYYNWFRYYAPSTGRYTQKDPIGLAGQDINIYGYGWNNPVNMTDPLGLQQIRPIPPIEPIPPVGPEVKPPLPGPLFIPIYILLDLLMNQEPVGLSPEQETDSIIDFIRNPKPEFQPEPDENNCYPDDFSRWCQKEEMKMITVYSINDGSYGHASLKVEGHVVGWWPVGSYSGLYDHLVIVDGRRRDRIDRMLVNDPVRYPRLEVKYDACAPQNDPINNSIEAINMSIMVHSNGEFNLLNAGARNCAGWVCQVLSWAGWAPLAPKQKLYTPGPEQVTCHTPGLVPIHLVPEGLTKELYDIEEIRERIRKEHYHF